MPTPASTPAKPAVAQTTPDKPARDEEKEALRKERDELAQRLERAQEGRRLERRSTDPGSDDFDAKLAIQRLWPGQVRE